MVDFRGLNEVTKDDRYPIPRMDDYLDCLGRARYYTTLDLKSVYWQVPMEESSKEKTAFLCQEGLFQFKVMPFGLKNAPAEFQRMMERILHPHVWKICLVYIDDIIVFSNTFEEHVENLKLILEALRRAKLTLKPEKCEFLPKKVHFLGHILDRNGISPDPEKVQAIKDFEFPDSVKRMQRFLGMLQWCKKFIPNLAKHAEPLYKLTAKKRNKWLVTEEHHKAFNALKEELVSVPFLRYPVMDGTAQFVLQTDASGTALGAVLYQESGDDRWVIAYSSRILKEEEKKWCATERECLAIIYGLKIYRHYLMGQKVLIKTDHRPLLSMKVNTQTNDKLKRWYAIINQFNHELQYVPGRQNAMADFLSRKDEPEDMVKSPPKWEGMFKSEGVLSDVPEMKEQEKQQISLERNERQQEQQQISLLSEEKLQNSLGDKEESELDWDIPYDAQKWNARNSPEDKKQHSIRVEAAVTRNKARVLEREKNENQEAGTSKTLKEPENVQWLFPEKEKEFQKPETPNDEEIPVGHISDAIMSKLQKADESLKPIWDRLGANSTTKYNSGFYEQNGVLYRETEEGSEDQIVVPINLREPKLHQHHGAVIMTHQGFKRTLSIIKKCHWWPGIENDVREWIKYCVVCQMATPGKTSIPPLIPIIPDGPFDIVSVDIVGISPMGERRPYVIVFQDYFTKWVEAEIIPDQTANTVVNAFLESVVFRHGTPTKLLSDNGSCFTSDLMKSVCDLLECRKIFTTAYHPQGNGMVERFNQTLIKQLRKVAIGEPDNWQRYLRSVVFAYNATPHAVTKSSPFALLRGHEANFGMNITKALKIVMPMNYEAYKFILTEHLTRLYENIAENIKKAAENSKRYFDSKIKTSKFKEQDWVLLKVDKHKKLGLTWEGPYIITDVSRLEENVVGITRHDNPLLRQKVSASRLKVFRYETTRFNQYAKNRLDSLTVPVKK